jgi:hypothetical protein
LEINCKNCGALTSGNFCANCGQKASIGRITWTNFIHEVTESVFQVNRGLIYTAKELFVRPGITLRGFLSGQRKNHFKPIAYALVLSTIYYIISQFTESETFINDAITGFNNAELRIKGPNARNAIMQWMDSHYAYATLLLLPLYALASFLAFLGSGFNYLEHVVINAYLIGQQAIIYLIGALISLFVPLLDLVSTITLILSMAYAFYVFWRLFKKQKRYVVLLQTLLTYFIAFIQLLLLLITLLAFTQA